MDSIELVAAVATIAAFLLAGWQHLQARRRRRDERERTSLQRERLRSMAVAATATVETAEYLVQRSKDGAAPREELTSIARVMRGQLSLVISQLEEEENLLAGPLSNRRIDSRRPNAAVGKPRTDPLTP